MGMCIVGRRGVTISCIFLSIASYTFAQPSAEFSATPVSGCSPIVVQFTDQSTGDPSQWKWDLGNGVISFLKDPSTTYFNPGTYNIKLVVRNANGMDSIIKNQFITVYPTPVVDFMASDTAGCFPLPVQFTDMSATGSGTITNYSWDFGDGDTSSSANPLHIYESGGNFSVTLKAINNYGCTKTFSKTQYIKISGGVIADFTNSDPPQCIPPVTVNFTNASTGPPSLSYNWSFGDGTTSDEVNPSHTYSTPGSYSVSLITTSSQGCEDTIAKINLITIGTITSQFSVPDTICQNNSVNFINTTVPSPASSSWDFGDGTNSGDINPIKKYTTAGTFIVKLVNHFSGCPDSVSRMVIVKEVPPIDFTSDNTRSCKTPFTVQFTNQTIGNNNYVWHFGDGQTSIDINPVHTYIDTGSYNVILVLSNENGCMDTITKPEYIQIREPVITLNGLPQKGCIPFTISPTSTIESSEPVANYLWNFGDGTTSDLPNPSHTYTVAGVYTVSLIISTANGCTDTVSMTEAVKVGEKPKAGFSVDPIDICAFQDIHFTDNSTGNIDQWLWQFGDGGSSTSQNPSHSYMDTGFFSVTLIVLSNSCADTLKLNNVVHIRPPIAEFATNRDCNNKFSIDFIDRSVGATGWSWDFGDGTNSDQSSPTHIYATAGVYTVTLTVTNGICNHLVQKSIQIIQEKANFVADNLGVCAGTTINFNQVNINPLFIANWQWDFGDGFTSITQGTASHKYATAGTYNVALIITDILGCTDTSRLSVTVFGPAARFSSSGSSVCFDQNAAVLFSDSSKADGTHPIVKWIWNYGDGTIDSTTPAPFSHLYNIAGTYDVSLTVVDNNGCRDSILKRATIIIADPVADFYSPDTVSCIDKPISFINTSVGDNLQYFWSFGDTLHSVDKNPIHNYPNTGNYVTSLVITDQYGCKDSIAKSQYINITVPEASFLVSDSFSTCPPMLVKFTNTSSDYKDVKWDFGDGNNSILEGPSHYYTLPGVYYAKLIVIGPGGCVDSANKKIDVRGPKGSFRYEPLSGCVPLNVKFIATTLDRISFTWDFSDGSTVSTPDSNVSHAYTSPGEYVPKMILSDITGCTVPIVGADTIRIVDVTAKFGLTKPLLCDSGYVNFFDSTVSNDLITNWQWSFGDGNSSSEQFPVYQYTSPGIYDVRLIVTTEMGCKDSLSLVDTVTVFKSPVINMIVDSAACVFSLLDVSGQVISNETNSLNWVWDLSNGNNFQNQDPPPQTYDIAGPQIITATVTDGHGCRDTVIRTININPLPNTDAEPNTLICLGSTIQLNATGADTYLWNTATDLSCLNCSDPIASPSRDTIYTVTGTNQYGCVKKDSVLIKVQYPLSLQIGPDDSICLGESVRLSASGNQQYSWNPSTGLDNANSSSPNASPSTSTLYTVIAKDSANCFSDTASVMITVFPIPTVEAGDDQTIEVGSNIQLHATGSGDVISWKWTPSIGLSCYDCPDPKAAPKQTTQYTLEVRNQGQCLSKDQLTIYVVCNQGNLYIPNTFSPNGDGMNDKFYPRGKGVFVIRSFRVFNRWGEMVFEKLNFNPNDANAGWDGKYKGKLLSPDVFVYTCEIVCENNQTLTYKGDVTLLQ